MFSSIGLLLIRKDTGCGSKNCVNMGQEMVFMDLIKKRTTPEKMREMREM